MTAHWIQIRGTELHPEWILRRRVLGTFPVCEVSVTHEGEVSTFWTCEPCPRYI